MKKKCKEKSQKKKKNANLKDWFVITIVVHINDLCLACLFDIIIKMLN